MFKSFFLFIAYFIDYNHPLIYVVSLLYENFVRACKKILV